MNRETLIQVLTKYEIQWFLDQDNQAYVDEVAQFFAEGGFTTWTTEDLQEKYDLQIAEEV